MSSLDGHVDALLAQANQAAVAGSFARAGRLFDQVATAERGRGRAEAASTALRYASCMYRFCGRPDDAVERARRATRSVRPDSPVRVAALVELGEGLRQAGRGRHAVAAYRQALDEGADLGGDQQAAIHRRIAAILMGSDRTAGLEELEAARVLHARAGNDAEAAAVAVEAATVLVDGSDPVAAQAALVASRTAASAIGDDRSLAQLNLLEAAQALRAGDPDGALDHLRDARRHSLAGTDPIDYLAAAVAIAELEDQQGDRVSAYRSLATAWATIGDLLGRDAAASAIEPRLLELRERWGTDEFAAVKQAHDDARRAERGTAS